jgi:hypothetical protein
MHKKKAPRPDQTLGFVDKEPHTRLPQKTRKVAAAIEVTSGEDETKLFARFENACCKGPISIQSIWGRRANGVHPSPRSDPTNDPY